MTTLTRTEICTIRTALGMTQADLAQVIGVHSMTVTKWESGALTLDGDNAAILVALLPWRAVDAARLGGELKHILATRGHLAARHRLLGSALGLIPRSHTKH